MLEDRDLYLVIDVQGQVLEGVEEGPLSGCMAWANASDGGNPVLGVDVVDAYGKGKSPVSWVSARGSDGNRESLTSSNRQSLKIGPQTFTVESGHAFIRNVEKALSHASIPKLRFSASLKSLMPLVGQVLDPSFPEAALPEQMSEGEIFSAYEPSCP